MVKKITEKRLSDRKHIKVQITVHDGEGFGDLYFETYDVSTGGIFITSDLLLDVGEKLHLEFQLPDSSNKPVIAEGTVVRVIRVPRLPTKDFKPGMGIKFTKITPEDQKRLEDFLTAVK
jgi:Tfp pilus assembly protein PilZ